MAIPEDAQFSSADGYVNVGPAEGETRTMRSASPSLQQIERNSDLSLLFAGARDSNGKPLILRVLKSRELCEHSQVYTFDSRTLRFLE